MLGQVGIKHENEHTFTNDEMWIYLYTLHTKLTKDMQSCTKMGVVVNKRNGTVSWEDKKYLKIRLSKTAYRLGYGKVLEDNGVDVIFYDDVLEVYHMAKNRGIYRISFFIYNMIAGCKYHKTIRKQIKQELEEKKSEKKLRKLQRKNANEVKDLINELEEIL